MTRFEVLKDIISLSKQNGGRVPKSLVYPPPVWKRLVASFKQDCPDLFSLDGSRTPAEDVDWDALQELTIGGVPVRCAAAWGRPAGERELRAREDRERADVYLRAVALGESERMAGFYGKSEIDAIRELLGLDNSSAVEPQARPQHVGAMVWPRIEETR